MSRIIAILLALLLSSTSNAIVNGHKSLKEIYKINTLYANSWDDVYNYFGDGNWATVYYGCNMTRISEEWILTSVYCVTGPNQIIQNLDNLWIVQNGIGSNNVTKVRTQPNYNQETFANNLALVHFPNFLESYLYAKYDGQYSYCADKNVDLTVYDECRSILAKVPSPPILLDVELDNLTTYLGLAASWDFVGSDPNTNDGSDPTGISVGTMQIHNGSLCEKIYGREYVRDEDHICTTGYQKPYRTCYYDSGSGLYIEHDIGINVLAGVAPYWDLECETKHTISVYSRISTHIDWIKSVVGENNLILASTLIKEQKIIEDNEILDLVVPIL